MSSIPFVSSGCRTRTHGDTSIGSFPTTGESWNLMRPQRRRGPHRRDVLLHRVLHLLEGAHLDLAHALPAEAEFLRQLRKRDLFLGEPARLEDAPLALVEHGERIGQRLARGCASSP